MIQPITLLGAVLCLGVLLLRYRSQPKNQKRSSLQQKLKTAKVLIAALLALAAINYTMQRMAETLDGAPAHEPSLIERAVLSFSK
jgi:hypothetical protein